jgi:hypothetical protein
MTQGTVSRLTWPGRPAISSATAMPSSEGLVREHRAAHAVADRPHVLGAGLAVLVDQHAAALVELHAGAFGQQALRGGAAAHGHQQLVDDDGLLALVVGVGDVDFLALDLGLATPSRRGGCPGPAS